MINAEQALERTREVPNKDQLRRIEKVIIQKTTEGKSMLNMPKKNISDATCTYLRGIGYSLHPALEIGPLGCIDLIVISWGDSLQCVV